MTQRHFIELDGIRLSYLDFGGSGAPLLALHGHFGCARMFAGLADALRDSWRVIALDQRGHGWSDDPGEFSRESYIRDAAQVIDRLGLKPAIVLGHSLGGINTYQIAARYPGHIRAMIVDEAGARTTGIPVFSTMEWKERFKSVKEVISFLEEKGFKAGDPYFLESLVEYEDGWGFRFNHASLIQSQERIKGDWWADWLGSDCPALLLNGHKSWALKTEHAREMAKRRPNTQLVEFPDCGHTIRDEDPEGYHKTVREFLQSL
ncbi:MAG: alpha/beta hydrolase [Anaerolineaceae bacterium]|jgi:pimeloyl-ACP methyl ester carboxylesterase|nr:MAG: alpha/beta hydrolase [Anaerolineaceae bacterium]